MIKSLRDTRLTDALPRIVRAQDWVYTLSDAWGRVHVQTLRLADESQIYTALDIVPEHILDALAVNLKIDWYDTGYRMEQKRRIVKTAIEVRRRMGTVRAVRMQLNAIYPGTDLTEWFQYGGSPHHFRIKIPIAEAVTLEMLERLVRSINMVKRLSSWLDEIHIVLPVLEKALHAGGRLVANTRLGTAERADVFDFQYTAYMGGGMGAQMELDTAEKTDVFHFRHTLHAGGQQMGAQAVLESRENLAAPVVTGRLRAGGCWNAAVRMGGAARVAAPRAGPRVRQSGCAYTIVPE